MKNIAIITARSGSKGIPNKNIRLMNGKPMMAYSIEAAYNSGIFDEVMVSTDSEEYADIARSYGAEVPFLRSQKTSGDTTGSWDVIIEVLEKYKQRALFFDTVCLLQPTSPLRTSEDIIDSYSFFNEKNADSVSSVCESEHHIQNLMILDGSLSLTEYRKHEIDLPRQLLPKCYRLNGAIFIRKIEYYNNSIELKNENEFAFIMDRRKSVDIDTVEEFAYAEFLMRQTSIG